MGEREGAFLAPERPRPILSGQPPPPGATDGKEPATSQQPVSAAAIRDPPAASNAKPRNFFGNIKELFGKLAEAVTGKPPPSLTAKRRKRREESEGAFSRALVLTARAVRRFVHHAANDDEQIHIETERLLRLEIDEYAKQQESFEDCSEAHYPPVAALDLKM